jgi:hypothetical protein
MAGQGPSLRFRAKLIQGLLARFAGQYRAMSQPIRPGMRGRTVFAGRFLTGPGVKRFDVGCEVAATSRRTASELEADTDVRDRGSSAGAGDEAFPVEGRRRHPPADCIEDQQHRRTAEG